MQNLDVKNWIWRFLEVILKFKKNYCTIKCVLKVGNILNSKIYDYHFLYYFLWDDKEKKSFEKLTIENKMIIIQIYKTYLKF